MPTSTVEDYLKQIYHQQQAFPDQLVPMGRLAQAMGVVPGTATTMIKALADSGLVNYEPRSGAKLSAAGEQLALHVLRRHRLVELFLVKVLGLDWSEVHEEAEELEHAISDKVLERIDELLERPSVDPHGDPIPTAKGQVEEVHFSSLLDCEVQTPLLITRILDQGSDFLNFANRSGLTPGASVTVQRRDVNADSISIHCSGHEPTALGTAAAAKVCVVSRQ